MADLRTFEDLVGLAQHRVGELAPDGLDGLFDPEKVGDEVRDAARWVLDRAPIESLLGSAKVYVPNTDAAEARVENPSADEAADAAEYASATLIPLPSDFYRLVRLRLSNWGRSVSEVQGPEAAVSAQKGLAVTLSGYEAAGATPFCARVVHAFTAEDDSTVVAEALACYPRSTESGRESVGASTDRVAEFLYVPEVEPESLPARLQDAVAWEAAARLLISDKDYAGLASACQVKRDEAMERAKPHKSPITRRRPVYLP